jgi:hypothetical protein
MTGFRHSSDYAAGTMTPLNGEELGAIRSRCEGTRAMIPRTAPRVTHTVLRLLANMISHNAQNPNNTWDQRASEFSTLAARRASAVHRRLRRRREAVERTVFESKRRETCALMAEKTEVCGTDCGKSATLAGNDLSVPRITHDPHCPCGQEGAS